MAFPVTTRYFIRFRHSDTGLTPTFLFFKNASNLSDITPPSIVEVAGGTYYFSWTFTTSASPDIVFEIDGGASIPTEEVRYVGDTISPRDYFIDASVDSVTTDIQSSITASQTAILNVINALDIPDPLDVAAIKAKTDLIPNDFLARLNRMLGLLKENSVLDNTVFDGQGNLQQGRLRIFPTQADALAGTNVIDTYAISASWSGQNIQNYTMTRA